MISFEREDNPKTEHLKLAKWVLVKSTLEYYSDKVLMKSKSVELMVSFEKDDIPKTEQLKLKGWS